MGSVTKLLFLFLLALNSVSYSKGITLPRTSEKPVIDGILNENIWSRSYHFTDLRSLKPDYGSPATETTDVFLTYDDENIYVAFICHDKEPGKIKATLAKRDTPLDDDWVAFCIDTYNDELNAYAFLVNPFGIQADGKLNSSAAADLSLDMVWESAAKLTDSGYVAEMKVPFSILRFPSGDPVTMGFKVARNIPRKSEEDDYPAFSPDKGPALAQFEKIQFNGIKPKQVLEILPEATFNVKNINTSGSLFPAPANNNFGISAKYSLTSTLIMDAAYNPDFSQVETDAGQIDVNLRHALSYPEKRPFFQEGLDYLGFSGSTNNTPLGAVVNTRNIADPLLGLKISGKLGENNILSVLYAVDKYPGELAKEEGNAELAGINASSGVIRYARNLSQDAYIGGFYTGYKWGGNINHVLGSDGRLRINDITSFDYNYFASLTKLANENGFTSGNSFTLKMNVSNKEWDTYAGIINVSQDFKTAMGYVTRTGITMLPFQVVRSFYLNKDLVKSINTYYWSRNSYDHPSRMFEANNMFGFTVKMTRQSEADISYKMGNEVFSGQKFNTDELDLRLKSQLMNEVSFQLSYSRGNSIYYDPSNPFQGKGNSYSLSLLLQPSEKL
ncbi:MAG: carbohydrate binding family 9 domain-containing protein, partial [Syntrophomonadaceae bacterium]